MTAKTHNWSVSQNPRIIGEGRLLYRIERIPDVWSLYQDPPYEMELLKRVRAQQEVNRAQNMPDAHLREIPENHLEATLEIARQSFQVMDTGELVDAHSMFRASVQRAENGEGLDRPEMRSLLELATTELLKRIDQIISEIETRGKAVYENFSDEIKILVSRLREVFREQINQLLALVKAIDPLIE